MRHRARCMSPFFTSRFSSAEIKAIGDKNRSAVTWDCTPVGEISSESSSVPIATDMIEVMGLPLDPSFAWMVPEVVKGELLFAGNTD